MRLVAGGLLVLMACAYLIALGHLDEGGAWPYAKAFAEAALVGGLADWFAVTALFRRPLGLPIPHTAIIPRSQARIAEAMGAFVADNFLSPGVVAARLAQEDLVSAWARYLSTPVVARKLADGLADTIPAVLDMLDDAAVRAFLQQQAAALGSDARLASLVGKALQSLTDQGRHQALVDAALQEGWKALEEHGPAIRSQVRARTSWVWRMVALDARASEALIASIEDTLLAIARDPNHPARARITAKLQAFAQELQFEPALQAEMSRIAGEILTHPQLVKYLDSLWTYTRAAVRTSVALEQTREGLAVAIAQLADALSRDQAAIQSLNRQVRMILAELAARHGADIAGLISNTIRSWDSRTIVSKLEDSVGPDLQYIRINGTLIGGLIGVCIHQAGVWLGPVLNSP
jgi:uncharacterized membrane-anchored protein YjiN (DUF445 family)